MSFHMTLSNDMVVNFRCDRTYPTRDHPSMIADHVELAMETLELFQKALRRADVSVPSTSTVEAVEDAKGQMQYCASLSFDLKHVMDEWMLLQKDGKDL